jgi:hypothetical protein
MCVAHKEVSRPRELSYHKAFLRHPAKMAPTGFIQHLLPKKKIVVSCYFGAFFTSLQANGPLIPPITFSDSYQFFEEGEKMLDESRPPTARTTKDKTDETLHRAKMRLNDEGNAKRLKATYGDDIIYIATQGWAVWCGSKYDLRQGSIR